MAMTTARYLKRHWQLYLFLLPAVGLLLVFHYVPIYGIQLAFKDFSARLGIWGSHWVGLEHFLRFFRSARFYEILRNTLAISWWSLVFGFPIPIIFDLALNGIRQQWYKKLVQTVTYAPNFISTVVLCGMIILFLSPSAGIINKALGLFGMKPRLFMGEPESFVAIYVISGIWQGTGWSSIIYLAALSGVNPELYEAATVDGASKLQLVWHIDLPSIAPTIAILLILAVGSLLGVGFEKAFLLQKDITLSRSEVISTYVYKVGLVNDDFGFSTAVGIFNSVINFVLLVTMNRVSRRLSEVALW
jgi:putative aldouronate transport system permease protein